MRMLLHFEKSCPSEKTTIFHQEDSDIIDVTAYKPKDWGASEEREKSSDNGSLEIAVQIN